MTVNSMKKVDTVVTTLSTANEEMSSVCHNTRKHIYTVLIVDDTKENIKVLANLLRKDYRTIIANSGEKALEILKKKAVDLVLLDVLMPPGINGFETCRILKEDKNTEDIPVVFITALNDKDSLVNGFSVGGVDYITKPFIHEEVLARVKVHIENHGMKKTRDEMIKGLEALTKGRSLEFANMSHELRTPLNAIIGYSEMIEDDIQDDAIDSKFLQKDMNKIISSSKYLLQLVNDILDLSKIEAEKMSVDCTEFPINNVLQELNSIAQVLAKKNNNTLNIAFDSQEIVFADHMRVQQILLNLLSNACKFTLNGDINISIQSKGDNIFITVSDTGRGMTEEEQLKMFQPFSQANKQTTKEYGGTGLGLSISKKIAELMRGDILMKSTYGKGSEFTLILPKK
jgi:two-component system, sensor histidine kinase and response regulator